MITYLKVKFVTISAIYVFTRFVNGSMARENLQHNSINSVTLTALLRGMVLHKPQRLNPDLQILTSPKKWRSQPKSRYSSTPKMTFEWSGEGSRDLEQ